MWLVRSAIDALARAGAPLARFAVASMVFCWLTLKTWPLIPLIFCFIGAFVVGRWLRTVHQERSGGW